MGDRRGRERGEAPLPRGRRLAPGRGDRRALRERGYATVEFELHYDDVPALPAQEGEAVVQDGVWKVSFATRCAVIRQTMVECP